MKKKKQKDISVKMLEEIFGDLFYNRVDKPLNKFLGPERTDAEIDIIIKHPDSPYNRILEGYWYASADNDIETGERQIKMHMGSGGAKMLYRELLRHLPESLAAEKILVHTDFGVYPLSVLTVTKITNDSKLDNTETIE